MGTLTNNSKVGDKGKDLVLQTSGRVYVQVKDRFYELNFRQEDNKNKDKEEDKSQSYILFIQDENVLESDEFVYPGDNYLIITQTGQLYKTVNETYEKIVLNIPITTTFTQPLTITTLEAPLVISSSALVKNLNAQYLNGLSSEKFIQKNTTELITKWNTKELIAEKIYNNDETTILDLNNSSLTIKKIYVEDIVSSSSDNSSGVGSRPNL